MDFEDRSYLLEMGGSPVAAFAPEALHDIRCYFEAMESFLSSSDGERRIRLQSKKTNVPSSVAEHLLHPENNLLWVDYFPSELRASVLVSLMSFFERYLNGVCAEAAILLRKPILHTQLRGNSIERAQLFLSNLCGFPGPKDQEWASVRTLQGIRNIVVHNGGALETGAELNRAKNLIKKVEGASCSELGMDFDAPFIRYAVSEVESFLLEMKSSFAAVCEDVKRFEGGA